MSLRTAAKSFARELRSTTPGPGMGIAAFLSWALGGEPTESGEPITSATALQQVTVYACVRVISESVATLPLRVYQRDGKSRLESPDHALSYLLGVEPNDEMSAVTFWDALTGALALTGNCYAEIQRRGSSDVVALWPLNPNLTTPKRDAKGVLYYETTDGMSGNSAGGGFATTTPRRIAAENMYHVPLFCFDGLKGISPIGLARQGIGLARAAELFGARFFGNGARAGGVLTAPEDIGDEELQAARKSWLETQGGKKQGSTAVLPGGEWKYTPITISPQDSQFIEVRGFQRTEIAALFRVAPSMVGDVTKQSKASAEQEQLSFVTDTLRPYLARHEAEIQRKLMPSKGRSAGRYFAEFDVSERLRGDFKTTMDGYAVAKQWGWMNSNMILEDQGKNPIGEIGDVFWVPVNMQNADRLLDTESVQDQPLGANPNPTPTEQKMLGKYTSAYISIFRDAFDRIIKRDKRDLAAVSSLFTPVLRSIADASIVDAIAHYGAQGELKPDGYVDAACKTLAKRLQALESTTDLVEFARAEFIRAVRSIHINTTRDAAAAMAEAQLNEAQ